MHSLPLHPKDQGNTESNGLQKSSVWSSINTKIQTTKEIFGGEVQATTAKTLGWLFNVPTAKPIQNILNQRLKNSTALLRANKSFNEGMIFVHVTFLPSLH